MLVKPVRLVSLPHGHIAARLREIEPRLTHCRDDYSDRWVAHADPVTEAFARQRVMPLVESYVGAALKPSYSYFSLYRAGAFLRPHVDRQMCVWTVTHTLFADPPGAELSWPLVINGQPVALAGGEAALFCGVAYPHWRDAMPAGMRAYASAYYHFVPELYDGPLS
jgi:hypothetical protein